VVTNGMEPQLHQKLEKLYISTRAGKVAWFFDFNYTLFCIVHVNLVRVNLVRVNLSLLL